MRQLINSVIDEVTTTSNVVFLPSQFRQTRKIIQGLAKKKKKMKVEILQDPRGRNVKFEDKINVSVPNLYWDKFATSILDMSPNYIFRNPLVVNMLHILQEAKEDVFEKEFQEFEKVFKSITKNKDFQDVISHRNIWLRFFKVQKEDVDDKNSVFTIGRFNRDFKNIVKQTKKVYRDDLGGLQQVIDGIKKEDSLINFEVFEKFGNLISTRILSRLGGEGLIYDVSLDLGFNFVESISTTSKLFLERLEDFPFIFVEQNTASPLGGKFTLLQIKNIWEELNEVLDEKEEKEDKDEELENDKK